MNKDDLLPLEKMFSIRARVRAGEYRFTVHALERRIERAILNGEIIEDYPEDKYGPGCLISGFTKEDRPMHVQLSDTWRC